MKVNIEIDCSPEEARRFMGLPDVEKANAVYIDALARAMQGAGSVDKLQEYAQQLAPMGQMGLKLFQSFVEGARKADWSGADRSGEGADRPPPRDTGNRGD
jgi:hypothetical protein